MKTIHTNEHQFLADNETPTGIYLKLRDRYAELILLESNDHHNRENSCSYICFSPLVSITVQSYQISFSGLKNSTSPIGLHAPITSYIQDFQEELRIHTSEDYHSINGLFGYTSFEAAQYFDNGIVPSKNPNVHLPEMHYAFYRFIIEFNHYHHTVRIIENCPEGDSQQLQDVLNHLNRPFIPAYPFQSVENETSNMDDEAYRSLVTNGKEHCKRGDVFQVVYSRQFKQPYNGDVFNVYRALRSINPSPYLFFFDYGNYAITGSSPEAQILIKNGKAQIHPIAGTFPRTNSHEEDEAKAEALMNDPKENAEHVMLVDLARNDLNRNTIDVHVKQYRSLEKYSHVIHMVSVVEGQTTNFKDSFQIFANTFPAGTLSGAPKIKALELIQKNENQRREFYGGAIGFMQLNGDLNHAIIIRSILAKDNTLYYQAGAGIVIDSDEQKELEEVNHKLAAIKKAIAQANHIKS